MKNMKEHVEKEKLLLELEQQFIEDFVKLRKGIHITQQEMANRAGVIRETIARIENCITSPQLKTLITVLEPLGYTVKIEKINNTKKDD